MRQDMYRRDFTINAMAINLTPGRFGELFDFSAASATSSAARSGCPSLSFLDDPTRAIRAVRFATRLGFEIAGETRQLARVAVLEGGVLRLSGSGWRRGADLLARAGP